MPQTEIESPELSFRYQKVSRIQYSLQSVAKLNSMDFNGADIPEIDIVDKELSYRRLFTWQMTYRRHASSRGCAASPPSPLCRCSLKSRLNQRTC